MHCDRNAVPECDIGPVRFEAVRIARGKLDRMSQRGEFLRHGLSNIRAGAENEHGRFGQSESLSACEDWNRSDQERASRVCLKSWARGSALCSVSAFIRLSLAR